MDAEQVIRSSSLCKAAGIFRRNTKTQLTLLLLQVVASLLVAAPAGIAKEAPPAQGPPAATPGAAVDADVETLRRLLGVAPPPRWTPQPPEPAAPAVEAAPSEVPAVEAAPAAAAEAPVKTAPAEVKTPAKGKSTPQTARPAPKRNAGKPAVVKSAPSSKKSVAAPPQEAAEETMAPQAVAEPETEAAEDIEAEAAAAMLADVPAPGTVVTVNELERWQHLLIPGQQWALRRGVKFNVIARSDIPAEASRLAATERYSSQVRLSADKRQLENYVAGYPFPMVDPNDPDAGVKLIFNYQARTTVDDLDVRNFRCATGSIDTKTGFRIEREYLSGHFRRLGYVSRVHVPPMPTWPNAEGMRSRESMFPILEPFDLKGAGFTSRRFVDATRPDDSWLYYPLQKRVRRLSTAQRSEGVFGQDVDLDSYAGFSGAPAWSEWRFLGMKTVLSCMHAKNLPAKWQEAPADFFPADEWEPRELYVIEGRSRLPGYGFSRRILYLDRQSFLIPMNEMYDLKGNLWKSEILTWRFGHKPRSEAVRAVYKDVLGFMPAFVLFDMQFNHATRCELPARDAVGEEGWYYHFGDAEGTTEQVFENATLIAGGR